MSTIWERLGSRRDCASSSRAGVSKEYVLLHHVRVSAWPEIVLTIYGTRSSRGATRILATRSPITTGRVFALGTSSCCLPFVWSAFARATGSLGVSKTLRRVGVSIHPSGRGLLRCLEFTRSSLTNAVAAPRGRSLQSSSSEAASTMPIWASSSIAVATEPALASFLASPTFS